MEENPAGLSNFGAPAAMNAINDALAPFKTHVHSQPITPQKILRALGKV
jgi:carbon-monoxide dehydrogenase large subunit